MNKSLLLLFISYLFVIFDYQHFLIPILAYELSEELSFFEPAALLYLVQLANIFAISKKTTEKVKTYYFLILLLCYIGTTFIIQMDLIGSISYGPLGFQSLFFFLFINTVVFAIIKIKAKKNHTPKKTNEE